MSSTPSRSTGLDSGAWKRDRLEQYVARLHEETRAVIAEHPWQGRPDDNPDAPADVQGGEVG
jgi:hypothetical protein